MIIFYIDEVTFCLKEVSSGIIYDTKVIRIKSKNILQNITGKLDGMWIGADLPLKQRFTG